MKAKHPSVNMRGRRSLHTAARENDLASVKILLRSGEFDVRVTNSGGETALHLLLSSRAILI